MQPRIDNLPALARAAAVPLLAALSAGLPLQVLAQPAWPSKPVRFIVPFPPGGPSDVVARIVAPRFQERLGQPVVVDNRPGAGTQIGTEIVARSAPDGHTLFLGSIVHAINVALYPKLPYESVKDFTMITVLTATPNLLVVHPALPVKSVADLVALGRKRPGELSFASSSNGSSNHLSGELLKTQAGFQMQHVPYKGSPQAHVDLLGGHVQLMFDSMLSVMPHVKSGRLRAIAVTSAKRSPVLPEVAAVSETLPGFDVVGWHGLMAPAGLPRPIVDRLHGEVVKIVAEPETRERFLTLGGTPGGMPPDEFAAYVRAEIAKWGAVVKASGARVD
ncbi:MAG: tripartite tricarboxylate transporter substrate binding protein [bacterium]|nr:tripartite tricarboxylate transporter substrate binding protein [Betaproteobacteria bacterium]